MKENLLILTEALELANQKGAFTLEQSTQVYSVLMMMKAELESKSTVPEKETEKPAE